MLVKGSFARTFIKNIDELAQEIQPEIWLALFGHGADYELLGLNYYFWNQINDIVNHLLNKDTGFLVVAGPAWAWAKETRYAYPAILQLLNFLGARRFTFANNSPSGYNAQ